MNNGIMLCGLALAAGCQQVRADDLKKSIDQQADDWLRKMSDSLAKTPAFQFGADHTLEVVTKSGEKLQFLARSQVSVQRPNMLRSDRTGAVADASLYYDGNTVTIFGKRARLYASSPAPDTLDAAIDFARDSLDLEAPAADMLYSNVYAGLMDMVVSGKYIGDEPLGDRMCHHLAYRERKTDWEIWVEDSDRALPCRYTITSIDVQGEPEFTVSFSNWNLTPNFPKDQFVFTPPSDATRIDFVGVKAPQVGRRP